MQTCLITGATSGLGRATALELGRLGWSLWLVGRNPRRGEAVADRINRSGTGAQAQFIRADVSSLAAMRSLAAQVERQAPRLDVLINNAGARHMDAAESADGVERTFATNHLGHFVLTLSLLGALGRSEDGRIINVASSAHRGGRGEFEEVLKASPYDGRRAYAESKLANVLFTLELARRLAGTRIKVNAVDPGGVATRFARNNGLVAWVRHCAFYLRHGSLLFPRRACRTIVWLASSAEATALTGGYYHDKKPVNMSPLARDAELAGRLWELSKRLVGASGSDVKN